MGYELYYWPGIQGRGEFIRLALEQAGLSYIDVAREADGIPALMRFLEGEDVVVIGFLRLVETFTCLCYGNLPWAPQP